MLNEKKPPDSTIHKEDTKNELSASTQGGTQRMVYVTKTTKSSHGTRQPYMMLKRECVIVKFARNHNKKKNNYLLST